MSTPPNDPAQLLASLMKGGTAMPGGARRAVRRKARWVRIRWQASSRSPIRWRRFSSSS